MHVTAQPDYFYHGKEKIPAKEVGSRLRALLKVVGAPERTVAQGIAMGETYFSRMKNRQSGFYRQESLHALERLDSVVKFAKDTLSEKGVKEWLQEPNPYLRGVPPILCLRSDGEMEKVLSLLAAIRYGFSA